MDKMNPVRVFNAKYVFGPADGLYSKIMSDADGEVPEISFRELYTMVEAKSQLGRYFFKSRVAEKVRIAVYRKDKVSKRGIKYKFVEMISYRDMLDKFGD